MSDNPCKFNTGQLFMFVSTTDDLKKKKKKRKRDFEDSEVDNGDF